MVRDLKAVYADIKEAREREYERDFEFFIEEIIFRLVRKSYPEDSTIHLQKNADSFIYLDGQYYGRTFRFAAANIDSFMKYLQQANFTTEIIPAIPAKTVSFQTLEIERNLFGFVKNVKLVDKEFAREIGAPEYLKISWTCPEQYKNTKKD